MGLFLSEELGDLVSELKLAVVLQSVIVFARVVISEVVRPFRPVS